MVFLRANDERCFFEVQGSDDEFHLYKLTGSEQISALYEFQLELVSEDPEIALDSLVGRAAVVTLQDQNSDDEEQIRFIHGLISAVEIGEQGERLTHYHVTLVPKIWPLSQRYNSRIFQNLSVPEIIEAILTDAGLSGDEFSFDLSASYAVRDYCVQYRESELDFIQRLLEAEGIHYYFEHEDDRHVLVMSDASTANPAVNGDPLIPYFHDAQGAVREQHIFRFRYRESVVPGKVTLRDYDFKKPKLQLQSDNQGEFFNELEVYDYPGSFNDAGLGRQRAQVQLQSLGRERQRAQGESDVNRLAPGYSFELEAHERDSLNRGYLVVAVRHKCRQPQVLEEGAGTEGSQYTNAFVCIPDDVPYRPARRTAQPRVEGSQTATVTGPAGEELYTDEFGRVKVQFHWDREGLSNEHSSCWIRVSQPAAGAGFGGFFLPRIGEEVVVDFLEGNPDRPLIIGRVYHGINRPPYPLPEQKTKSTLKSNSSKGGEGFNELRFEDKKGEEQIFIHAEKDLDLRIKNDRREWVGRHSHHQTLGNRYSQIQGEEHLTCDGPRHSHLKQDEHLSIDGSRQTKVGQSESLQAGQQIYIKAGQKVVIEAGAELTIKAGGSFVKLDPSGVSINGTMLNLGGGSPGSGSGASAQKPSIPAEADSGFSGLVAEPREPETVPAPNPLDITTAKASLYKAAQEGRALVETCSHGEGCQCTVHPA